MGEVADLIRRNRVTLAEQADAFDHLGSRLIRAREDLQAVELPARLVEHREISERSADIHSDSVSHPTTYRPISLFQVSIHLP
jgi:hypothetical protein